MWHGKKIGCFIREEGDTCNTSIGWESTHKDASPQTQNKQNMK